MTPRYSVAIAAHSTCQPGLPGPKPDGHEGSPGRAASHTSGSSGSFFPGRSGSPPRSANSSVISAGPSRDTAPNRGSADLAWYRSPSSSYSTPWSASRPLNRSMTGSASTAPM